MVEKTNVGNGWRVSASEKQYVTITAEQFQDKWWVKIDGSNVTAEMHAAKSEEQAMELVNETADHAVKTYTIRSKAVDILKLLVG